MGNLLDDIRCIPSRKPLKFKCQNYTRNCLLFDSTISREDRHVLMMEIFACRTSVSVPDAAPHFLPPRYTPEELLELRVVCDHRHPAYGQLGLYARKTIPSNIVVTSYAGFIEIFGSSCNSRTYTMGFGNVGDDFALDAEFAGNYGRFANDPRGVVGLSANLIAENRMNSRGESFTALVSRRQILEGEEILMSYGKAHSLSSSAWMNVQGEPIMRPRWGGMIPFPALGDHDGGFSYELMFECCQCGMWSHAGDSKLKLPSCCHCRTPQLSGCPLVGVLTASGSSGGPQRPRPALGTSKNTTASSYYEAKRVEWPISVPFLPWQIWDPTVPIHVVLKHSKYESQKHLFLYNVSWTLASDEDGESDSGDESTTTQDSTSLGNKRQRGDCPEKRSDPPLMQFCETNHPGIKSAALLVAKNEGAALETPTTCELPLSEYLVLLQGNTWLQQLRSNLIGIRRRLCVGKAFEPGEIVGYAGGIIRHKSDRRSRPDNSPMEIPMRLLLPRNCMSTDNDTRICIQDLLQRLNDLVVVVTNEMMYCPCLAYEGILDSARLEALQESNVTFSLTVDALGSPLIACIATKKLRAFEPLLARLQ